MTKAVAFLTGAVAAASLAQAASATGPNECANLRVSGLGVFAGILRPVGSDTYKLTTRCGQAAIVEVDRATKILGGSGGRIPVGDLRTAQKVEVSGAIGADTIRAITIQLI